MQCALRKHGHRLSQETAIVRARPAWCLGIYLRSGELRERRGVQDCKIAFGCERGIKVEEEVNARRAESQRRKKPQKAYTSYWPLKPARA